MTGPSAGPRCADGLMVCAKRNSMFPNAMESALTATTSSPATTTALTTCNGCRILVIKRKRSVRTQRGTPSASECENIRRNVSPACSTDPSGVGGDSHGLPVKNRRIAPPVMHAPRTPVFRDISFLSEPSLLYRSWRLYSPYGAKWCFRAARTGWSALVFYVMSRY